MSDAGSETLSSYEIDPYVEQRYQLCIQFGEFYSVENNAASDSMRLFLEYVL